MKLDKIVAGSFLADGGAMFGVVPKRVWQKRYPCNDDNFWTLMMRCLVIKTDEKLIVIDTGTGVKQLEYLKYYHFKDIYDLVEWSCAEDAAIALAGKKTYDTWQEGFLAIFEIMKKDKPFIINIYRTNH